MRYFPDPRRMLLLAVLFIITITSTVQSQAYQWPTDASKLLTSSFCEFRPRHYHAAIDIKTWGQSGYRIFAVADGHIMRLRVAATGYGKAIYLQLDDGNVVVYAHLDGFTREINAYADSLRLRNKRTILDNYPQASRFRVKKGDFLGYTGETGIGVPHLHFEIRNRHHQPINPLQFYPNTVADHIAPKARYLAAVPATPFSFVNFQPDTLITAVPQEKVSRVDEPIYVTGDVYLAMRTYDLADGMHNRFDLYSAKMYINDSLAYEVKYDRFSYDENRLIELDKNFSLWRKGLRIYHNFYRHPANSLPFYGRSGANAGMLNARSLRIGKNQVRIDVFDYNGNSCSVHIPVIYHPVVPVLVYQKTRAENALLVGLSSPEPLDHIVVNRVNGNLSQSTRVMGEQLQGGEKIMELYRYHISVPLEGQESGSYFQLIPYRTADAPSLPLYLNPSGQPGAEITEDTPPYLKFIGAGMQARVSAPAQVPLSTTEGLRYEFLPGRYLDALANGRSAALPARLDPVAAEAASRWTAVIPGQICKLQSEDGRVELRFPPNASYGPLFSTIRQREPVRPIKAPYAYLSGLYEALPFDEPLNYGAYITVTVPDSIAQKKGVGIYYFDDRKGWLFLPTQPDAASNSFTARVTSLETFVVIQDPIGPTVTELNLKQFNTAASSQKPALRLRVKDELSGMYNESQITVRVNGNWTLFEFDPEEDYIRIFPRHLPAGTNQLTVIARDNAGNQTVKSFEVVR